MLKSIKETMWSEIGYTKGKSNNKITTNNNINYYFLRRDIINYLLLLFIKNTS